MFYLSTPATRRRGKVHVIRMDGGRCDSARSEDHFRALCSTTWRAEGTRPTGYAPPDIDESVPEGLTVCVRCEKVRTRMAERAANLAAASH